MSSPSSFLSPTPPLVLNALPKRFVYPFFSPLFHLSSRTRHASLHSSSRTLHSSSHLSSTLSAGVCCDRGQSNLLLREPLSSSHHCGWQGAHTVPGKYSAATPTSPLPSFNAYPLPIDPCSHFSSFILSHQPSSLPFFPVTP